MTRRASFVVLGWVATTGLAVFGLGGSAAAQVARSGPPAASHARPVAGPAARAAAPAASTGQECFFTFPDCTSGDPAVAFTMNSHNDTTGCVFQQDTEWGDGSNTTLNYNGGSDGTALVTFQHTYAAPGVYQISYTIVVQKQTGACLGGDGSLQFTLPAPPDISCQAAQVSIPAVQAPVRLTTNPLHFSYGPTPASFTPGQTSGGTFCSMQSNASVMPVDLDVPGAGAIKIAQIGSTDTVGFLAADDPAVAHLPDCDFGALTAISDPESTPPVSDFAGTTSCLLTPTFGASWDVVAKWTSPGFTVAYRSATTGHQVAFYSTGPLTYYVDLDTLPNSPGSSATFTQTMQALESYIRTTLLQNFPVIDKIALFQVGPGRAQVTDPLGRLVGIGTDTKITRSFPGAGYAKAAGRAVAWIFEPVPGTYHVTVRGKARSKFQADFTILQLLGHGDAPLIKNIKWKASLGGGGTAAAKFPDAGQAVTPVPQTHESRTRAAKGQQVTFNLDHTLVPFGPATVLWSFGDGAKSTRSSTAHRYKRAGHYTPEVTITNSLGYSVTATLPEIVVTG